MLDGAKRFVPQLFMLFVAIGVSDCSRTVNLGFPPTCQLLSRQSTRIQEPRLWNRAKSRCHHNAPEHRRLQKWIAENSAAGLKHRSRSRRWHHRRCGQASFACSLKAAFLHRCRTVIGQKTVRKDDYAYLEEAAAHLTDP